MTNQDLKDALLSKNPVRYNGIEYTAVSAIIYRSSGKNIVVTAELLDKNENCVVIAPAGKVELVEEKDEA